MTMMMVMVGNGNRDEESKRGALNTGHWAATNGYYDEPWPRAPHALSPYFIGTCDDGDDSDDVT